MHRFYCGILHCGILLISFLLVNIPGYGQSENAGGSGGQTPESYRKSVETFARLDQSNNYTESLSYVDMNVLPMGIKQTLSNIEVTIAVSDMRWETTHSELTVFARVKIPQESKTLFFGAQGIKLSNNGDIIGDASLVLLGDVSIPINGNTAALTLKGDFDVNTGRGKELTYVSIDCKGFKEMGITAEVEFAESLLRPVDEKGKVVPGRVKGSFKTVVTDWNDVLATISLQPFEVKGLDGFVFTLSEAVFDFSDFRNDPSIVYPEGYEARYLIPGNVGLWRGVYIRDLVVTLPPQFSRKDKTRVSFGAHNMLLDNNGISGVFAATGILPIEQGSASGWRFSVDTFSLTLEANQLTAAGFSGLIGLPVSEKSDLGYDAIISADNDYLLRVKPMGKYNFDVFHAKAELLPNSYVALEVSDGKFKPEAMLHGSLNFAPKLGSNAQDTTGKAIADFKGIEFRSLHLKTESPRFTAEYFGYRGELKMMNFPISVDRIGLRVQEDEIALGLDIKLTLSDNMFTGSTRLEVVGALKETGGNGEEGGGSQRWQYEKLNISNIAINAKIAETFSMKAQLTILNDDPIYGDGYAGSLELTFDKVLKGMEIKARAMFGRKDFRYWFVDGRVKFGGAGIPVFPPLNINGFGGGVSYRMKRDGADLLASPTGCKYVPDANTGIGVKASVLFNVANDAAINGEASFEIAFSNSGGLNFIGFYGYAKFVGKIPGTENIEKFVGDKMKKVADLEEKFVNNNPALKKTLQDLKQYEPNKAAAAVFEPSEKPGEAGFAAAVGIQYDFTQSSFHATFDLYVNAIGGVIRGTASGNRAGWAVIHIDPKEWYVHMGTPTDRLGLKMGIGSISVETGSYLMLGSRIPGSPPPPREVADILGVEMDELDYMRDLNALGDGRGFAFGASLKIATGDLTFLVLYANFQAGLGFDIMLKDYGDMECKGRSGAIGMNGWFANGQSYVYLQGELGIKVNLWFLKTKIPIIQGAAAALMQAKLPNPTFVKGYLGVQFNLLGGLVKGSCRFKVTLGEECELVVPGSSPIDMRMIADLTPKTNSEVDVFAAPQAAFNMRVGVPFDVEDDQGPKTFRIQLNEFTVTDNGTPVTGKLVWTDNKDGVSFYSHEVLPPARSLRAVVTVGFEQYANGKWVVVYTSGQKAQESMEVTFTTGTAPDVIPLQNVEFSYPVVEQKFFLKGESPTGIIQLKRGQSYLFSDEYKNEMHLARTDGTYSAVPFTYSAASNRIEYSMPELSGQTGYAANIVLMSKNGTGADGGPTVTTADAGAGNDVITVSNAQASNVVRTDVGKSLLEYSFTTSRYATFAEKMTANAPRSSSWQKVSSTIINLLYMVNVAEPFDPIDLRGNDYTGGHPLVAGVATLNDPFFQQFMNPVIYSQYPVGGVTFAERDPLVYGVPPSKAVNVMTGYLTEIENGMYTNYASQYLPFVYALPQVYQEDFADIQNQLVNKLVDTPALGQYSAIVNGNCPAFPAGSYRVKFQYTLPDGTKGTVADFDYINTLK